MQVLQAANTGITSLQKLVDTAKSIANQALQQPAGYSAKANVTFTGASAATGTATAASLNAGALTGGVFTFTNSSGTNVAITIGATASAYSSTTHAATVTSIDDFNKALTDGGINLSVSLSSATTLAFASTNDNASQVITTSSGTAAPTAAPAANTVNINAATAVATAGSVTAAVSDSNSLTARSSLVAQYNQIIDQITTTAQDASFNGVNLLNGDSLKLVFNETGKSTSTIAGVTFNPNGLGLKSLAAGTDFTDNAKTNAVLTSLNNASTTLRSQASAFGANLSIVQIRQDFSKNIINVLQTGSSNLTLADANEEAANSQALSTRQSIAVSALALANQSNQSVLQLLR